VIYAMFLTSTRVLLVWDAIYTYYPALKGSVHGCGSYFFAILKLHIVNRMGNCSTLALCADRVCFMPVVKIIYNKGRHVDTCHKPKVIQDPQKTQLSSDDASFANHRSSLNLHYYDRRFVLRTNRTTSRDYRKISCAYGLRGDRFTNTRRRNRRD